MAASQAVSTFQIVGEFVLGGGGVALALTLLKVGTTMGRVAQMLDDHDRRIDRVEDNQDEDYRRRRRGNDDK
jgi:hypothetical protein